MWTGCEVIENDLEIKGKLPAFIQAGSDLLNENAYNNANNKY